MATLAAALSLALIVGLVLLSRFKHDITWMTVDFLDFVIIDFSTIGFLLTIYPELVRTVVIVVALAVPLAVLLWRFDPFRVGRGVAALGCVACRYSACPACRRPRRVAGGRCFLPNNYAPKSRAPGVAAVSELVTHGLLNRMPRRRRPRARP